MSNFIDEFVTELIETGSTGSKDNPDYTPPMYKRTPGQWTWEYVPDKGYALYVENPEDNSECKIHPTNGDMQLMCHAPRMYRLLWRFADDYEVKKLLAKIDVEPDPDLNIPEELISEVKASRNTGA